MSFRPSSFLRVLLMIGFGLLFGGSAMAGTVTPIEAQALAQKLQSANPPFLLDVREPYETAQGIIDGAVVIPLGDLETRLNEVPKDRPIVVYCRSGNRSSHAAALLQEKGFSKIENLTGGIGAWQKVGKLSPEPKSK